MTPEERFESHEQWLLDHDKVMARHDQDMIEIKEILKQISNIQRRQAATLLELTKIILEREQGEE